LVPGIENVSRETFWYDALELQTGIAQLLVSSRQYATASNVLIMNVLLLASGGREHAIAIALASQPVA
jgi:hypothetical protein